MGQIITEKNKNLETESIRRGLAKVIKRTSLIMCIYFVVILLLYLIYSCEAMILFGVVGCGAFITTYHLADIGKVKQSIMLVYVAIILYVLAFVYVFGWKGGAQLFLFIAPVLVLIADFFDIKTKILCSIFACALRFVLFYLHNMNLSIYVMPESVQFYLEVINTIGFFVFLCYCIMLFSEEVYTLEQNLVHYNKLLSTLASEDPVTGLDNRRSILDYLKNLIVDYGTESITSLSVSVGDIDFFKKVNDTYGHECGDEVLRQLSDLFRDYMVGKGKVGRWGGEEFLFVFKNADGKKANQYLEDLLNEIRNKDFEYKEYHISLTMTFGLEEYTMNQGIDNVIVEADKKLYYGKESGRNKVVLEKRITGN